MSHTSSLPKASQPLGSLQQKIPFAHYYRTASNNYKLPSPLLFEQLSPRDLKPSFEGSPRFQQQGSPQQLSSMLHCYSTATLEGKRRFYAPLPTRKYEISQTKPRDSISDNYSQEKKEGPRPKVVFSYNRKDSLQAPRISTLPNSCGTAKSNDYIERITVEEFELNHFKNTKKNKNLKICSNQFNHFVVPVKPKGLKKGTSLSRDKYFRTAQASNKIFKYSGTGFPTGFEERPRNKESKIASTEATRSFQADDKNSEAVTSACHPEATFDFSSIHSLNDPLNGTTPLPKALKKTMTFSRYDFGGIIDPSMVGTCPHKQLSGMELSEQKYNWKSYVKQLFTGDQDLKKSIHCGPQIRADSTKLDFLTGFGRQIAESCIPDSESFQ